LLKKIITVLVVVFFTLAAIEVFLRILQPDGAERIPAFVVDEQTGWARPPNQHGFLVQRVPGIFKTHFQTNSRGMRDHEYPLEKREKLRILALGDSVTEGWGVEQEETYPKILESQCLRDVEVWNLGVVGYSTDQELQQLRRVIETYRPDVVTLAFYFNDLAENSLSRTRWWPNYVKPHFAIQGNKLVLTDAPELLEQKRGADRQAHTWGAHARNALNSSALYRLTRYVAKTVYDRWRERQPRERPTRGGRSPEWWGMDNLFRLEQSEELNSAWRLSEHLLVEANRLCESHGAKFVLVYVPSPVDGVPEMMSVFLNRMGVNEPLSDFDVTIVERRLSEVATRNGIRFVPAGARFRSSANPAQLFLPQLPRDPHIGKQGHELVAHILAEYLQRQHMLPQANFRPEVSAEPTSSGSTPPR
jgi:hypothetical protein